MPTPKRLNERVYMCPLIVTMRDSEWPDDFPSVEVTADVTNNEMQIRRVSFVAEPGERQIQRADLKAVSLDDIREQIIADFGMQPDSKTGTATLTLMTSGEQQPTSVGNKRNARRATRVDLSRVAKIYNAADRAPTKAVAEAFDKSLRWATTYVAQAREKGLIDG